MFFEDLTKASSLMHTLCGPAKDASAVMSTAVPAPSIVTESANRLTCPPIAPQETQAPLRIISCGVAPCTVKLFVTAQITSSN